jgi:hypothetical protein
VNHEVFSKIVKEQQELCNDVLIEKAAEYATEDRLHNFRVSAALQGCTMRQALAGYMAKHTTSIFDMCFSMEEFSMAKWDEKITDHLNYLLLLKAVVTEEKGAV